MAELRFAKQVGTVGSEMFLDAYVDSDRAGDIGSRRSTTGLCVMVGGYFIKHASLLQSQICLSSGGSRVLCAVQGSCHRFGVGQQFSDLGSRAVLRCHSGSSTARAVASRRRLGNFRHVYIRFPWLQSQVAQNTLQLRCVHGPQNPADALTKPLIEAELFRHCTNLGLSFDVSAPHSAGDPGQV